MPAVSAVGITELLTAWGNDDQVGLEKLVPLTLDDLRRIAKHHLHQKRSGRSLRTADLVNETYLRLAGMRGVHWKDRADEAWPLRELDRRYTDES